ncbi:MAG TPA: DUF177 domain-containing protein [Bryobacteraceae bacterium]|nr:DUF177 domain-containing protein [Bryobacteraceae bacterium]
MRVFISLQQLELRSVPFKVDIPTNEIDYGSEITQSSVLHAEGSAQLLNHSLGEVRVQGDLTVAMQAICDRCLESANFPVERHFDLVYMPATEAAIGGEKEIHHAGIEVGYYEGSGLALNDVLREVILLALPMRLVCSEACKGICPMCGQNRNQHDCGCQPEPVDNRLHKLKIFRAEIGPSN